MLRKGTVARQPAPSGPTVSRKRRLAEDGDGSTHGSDLAPPPNKKSSTLTETTDTAVTARPADKRGRGRPRKVQPENKANDIDSLGNTPTTFQARETTSLHKARQYLQLTAKMPLKALNTIWTGRRQNRPIDPNHVEHLCSIFRDGGLARTSSENALQVLTSSNDLYTMLLAQRESPDLHITGSVSEALNGSPVTAESLRKEIEHHKDMLVGNEVFDFSRWPDINSGKVEVLAGQHRISALQKYIEETGAGQEECWWHCDVYISGR